MKTPNPPKTMPENDALGDLVGRIVAREPEFAAEWAAFTAALDLRMKRKAAGLSQADVGERLGIDQSGVARIERDPSGVSLKRFRTYLAVLGYEITIVPIDPKNASPPEAREEV